LNKVLDKLAEISSHVNDLHMAVHKMAVDFEYHKDNVKAKLDRANDRARRLRKIIMARDKVCVCAFALVLLVCAAMAVM
jgi:outer membrane murein-binding lipoprotein Lpp